jgi:MtN3 and saliva related transmembrane protein
MMPNVAGVDILGYMAGFLTTMSCLPQVFKSWRRRSVRDLSLTMLLMLTVGLMFWMAYGVITNDWPILLANGVSLLLWSSLLVFKIRERAKGHSELRASRF